MKTVAMKENNIPLADRMREFPWLLSDLIFPFMVEYLVSIQPHEKHNERRRLRKLI